MVQTIRSRHFKSPGRAASIFAVPFPPGMWAETTAAALPALCATTPVRAKVSCSCTRACSRALCRGAHECDMKAPRTARGQEKNKERSATSASGVRVAPGRERAAKTHRAQDRAQSLPHSASTTLVRCGLGWVSCVKEIRSFFREMCSFIHRSIATGTYKTKSTRKPARLTILVILHTSTYATV